MISTCNYVIKMHSSCIFNDVRPICLLRFQAHRQVSNSYLIYFRTGRRPESDLAISIIQSRAVFLLARSCYRSDRCHWSGKKKIGTGSLVPCSVNPAWEISFKTSQVRKRREIPSNQLSRPQRVHLTRAINVLLTVTGSGVSCAARKKLTAAAHGWLDLKSSQYIPQCRSLAILQRPPPRGFFWSRLPLCVWLPRFRLTVPAKVTTQMKNTESQL